MTNYFLPLDLTVNGPAKQFLKGRLQKCARVAKQVEKDIDAYSIDVGTIGNFGVCVIFARRRDLRYVPHQLLASLSLKGLLSSLISAPAVLGVAVVNYFPAIGNVSLDLLCKIGYSSFMDLAKSTLYVCPRGH